MTARRMARATLLFSALAFWARPAAAGSCDHLFIGKTVDVTVMVEEYFPFYQEKNAAFYAAHGRIFTVTKIDFATRRAVIASTRSGHEIDAPCYAVD